MATITSSPVDQSSKSFSLDGGDTDIAICDSMEENTNDLKTAAIAMDFASDDVGLEQKQQHPSPSNDISTTSSTTVCTSSDEKDEKMLTTNNDENVKIILVNRVKVKAKRPSLNAFFKQAAAAAAARQEQRPKTRNGGKRDGTNQFSSDGALKKPDGEPSTKSNNSGSRKVGDNSGKRRKTEKGENAPPSKKHKKTSLPPLQAAAQPATSHQQAQVKRPVNEKIVEPNPDDVLMGRGSHIANWHGNIKFRKAVWSQRPAYALCDKSGKTTLTENLVKQIQQRGCRFLEMTGKLRTTSPRSPHGMVWVEASFERALEKTSKALCDPNWTIKTNTRSDDSSPSNSDSSSSAPTDEPGNHLSNSLERKKLAATTTLTNTQQSMPLADMPYRPDYAVAEDYPLIALPRANDVLVGRGWSVTHHHGNVQFRLFVRNNRQRYLSDKKQNKVNVAREVVDMVVQTGGRFLELAGDDVMTGPWKHASFATCLEKTCQALRESRWGASSSNTPSPSPRPERLIPLEDPESATSNPSLKLASRSPANAKVGSDHSSAESSPQQEEHASSSASTQEQMVSKEMANEDIVGDAKTAEDQMGMLGDGSRVAVYWPLDKAYYEGTVEDRLQDNFFYVRYDDGESEWLDFSKHAFKVIKAASQVAPVAPAAVRKAAKKKESTVKKKSEKESRGGGKEKSTGNARKNTKKNPVIRSSAQRSKQILDSIAKHGSDDWELVASEVPDWSADDCRRRWDLYLDPTLSKEPFTEDEVREIMLLQSEHGNDWASIAPNLTIPRSCDFLSNKWNRKFRNNILPHLLKLGLTRNQIEGDEKKRINYHGHFESVVKVVVAAKLGDHCR